MCHLLGYFLNTAGSAAAHKSYVSVHIGWSCNISLVPVLIHKLHCLLTSRFYESLVVTQTCKTDWVHKFATVLLLLNLCGTRWFF